MDGDYTYCFGNKMSTMTPKVIMFSMDIEEAQKHDASNANGSSDNNHNKLQEQVAELASSLTAVKHEQEYMAVRYRIHRQINKFNVIRFANLFAWVFLNFSNFMLFFSSVFSS